MKLQIAVRPARWKLAAAGCGVALLAAACGSGSSTTSPGASSHSPAASSATSAPASSTTAPTSSVLCADAAALRASLNKLGHVTVNKNAKSEIMADLAAVKANLTTFAADARGQWQAQTSALKAALTSLQTAVKALAANPSTSAVGAVVTALGGVTTAARQLLAAVSTRCPSASPAG
jgi:hypothetical protein